MGRIKVVSFDMEGTLVDSSLSDLIWEVDIPRLYAERHNLGFHEAQGVVFEEYLTIGEHSPEWYDADYWFRRFGLEGDWRPLLEERRRDCRAYPEVSETLERVSGRFPLVVSSNTIREFLEVQLSVLPPVFSRVFSAPSDFGVVKKSGEFYGRVCTCLGIEPETLAHVGDSRRYDYDEARALGVEAYLLDRSGGRKGEHIIWDLLEFEEKISVEDGKC